MIVPVGHSLHQPYCSISQRGVSGCSCARWEAMYNTISEQLGIEEVLSFPKKKEISVMTWGRAHIPSQPGHHRLFALLWYELADTLRREEASRRHKSKLRPVSVRVIFVIYELQGSRSKDIFEITIYNFLCLVKRSFNPRDMGPWLIRSPDYQRSNCRTSFALGGMHCKSWTSQRSQQHPRCIPSLINHHLATQTLARRYQTTCTP
jgi:hypothetical protein